MSYGFSSRRTIFFIYYPLLVPMVPQIPGGGSSLGGASNTKKKTSERVPRNSSMRETRRAAALNQIVGLKELVKKSIAVKKALLRVKLTGKETMASRLTSSLLKSAPLINKNPSLINSQP